MGSGDDFTVVVHPDAVPIEIMDDGCEWVCLPKSLYPTRGKAKVAASSGDFYAVTDWYPLVRCRTVWMHCADRYDDDGNRFDSEWDEGHVWYRCLPEAEGAIECWECRAAPYRAAAAGLVEHRDGQT